MGVYRSTLEAPPRYGRMTIKVEVATRAQARRRAGAATTRGHYRSKAMPCWSFRASLGVLPLARTEADALTEFKSRRRLEIP